MYYFPMFLFLKEIIFFKRASDRNSFQHHFPQLNWAVTSKASLFRIENRVQ
jgi:hypothetical protein